MASAAARFDHALRHAWKRCRAPSQTAPQYSQTWPPENIALLDQYRAWLLDGGTGVCMVDQIYIPTAGYALGLNLKPAAEWDLEADLNRALEYIHARRLSAISTHIRHSAMEKSPSGPQPETSTLLAVMGPERAVCTAFPKGSWRVEISAGKRRSVFHAFSAGITA